MFRACGLSFQQKRTRRFVSGNSVHICFIPAALEQRWWIACKCSQGPQSRTGVDLPLNWHRQKPTTKQWCLQGSHFRSFDSVPNPAESLCHVTSFCGKQNKNKLKDSVVGSSIGTCHDNKNVPCLLTFVIQFLTQALILWTCNTFNPYISKPFCEMRDAV